MRNRLWTVFVGIVMSWCADSVVSAQGLQSSPYAAPSLLQGEGLSSALSNPFDRSNTYGGIMNQSPNHPTAASTPKDIPNLQAGYVYFSSKNWRASYLTLDYILPVRLSEDSMIYGEVHSEFQTTATKASRRALDQTYLSAGGGYRTLLRKTTLIGANGFYDAARFSNQWMGSGGAGLEMATLLNGHDALDVNFNWYANLANVDGFVRNPARNGPANFDLQVGYSHQMWHGGPDLRLYGTAYKFDDGGGVYGWQAGLELKSANGVLSAKGETAYDPVDYSYQTVGAFVNIGFQVENLLKGRNPFVMPERIFNSPRNLNRLADKVKRHWRHTTHGVFLASAPQTITVVNNRDAAVTLYMGFIGAVGWGSYSAADFPGFTVAPTSCNADGNILYRTVQKGEQVVINFDPSKGQVSPAFSADQCTWNCPQTIGEFTLQGYASQDITDISLVNGFNYPMQLASSNTATPTILVTSSTGNMNKYGVFPLYCDQCDQSVQPGCPVPPDQSECSPNNQCQVWQPAGANYTLSILPN